MKHLKKICVFCEDTMGLFVATDKANRFIKTRLFLEE